ncbi:hypothetical protein Sango_0789100 [Sesamum angolense]|uniref:Uncharacterized protein n=1 Tax=Sesamum angolense TaxID=2727404 RepID=A0AAE1X2T9_9LAMI|nr:hypothetical protein Sango_0789100 [Sesamum angolense]
MGPFEGKTNLSVVVIDDFKLIPRLELLRDTHTAVLPHVDSLMMLGPKPCIIPALAGRTGEKNLLAMQFEKGRKRNEPSYLCTLCFEEIEQASGPIPGVMKKYADNNRHFVEFNAGDLVMVKVPDPRLSKLKKYSADKEDEGRNQPSHLQLELTKTKEKVAEAILNHRVTSTESAIIMSTW